MRLFATVLLSATLAACTAVRTSPEVNPDREFGHRAEESEDGRVTTVIGPEDGTQTYRYDEAFVEQLFVRPGPQATVPVPVEILVKGVFPDACTELHEAIQTRSGNIVEVSLTTRRAQGALCAAVLRPYRFYLTLDGTFAAGPYTLRLNGQAHPFEIRSLNSEGS